MSRFRSVDGAQAGPRALGLLLPPGRRTLVLLRPRALAVDLVPLRTPIRNGAARVFQEVSRHEAEALARRLYQDLNENVGEVRVEAIRSPGRDGYWVQAQVGAVVFLACRRVPDQPYQALIFATLAEAEAQVAALAEILRPAADACQELYLNTRNFGR